VACVLLSVAVACMQQRAPDAHHYLRVKVIAPIKASDKHYGVERQLRAKLLQTFCSASIVRDSEPLITHRFGLIAQWCMFEL
jgi:hypothetical protein